MLASGERTTGWTHEFAAVAAFVINSLVNDTTNSVITFVVILAGIPVYAVAFARNRA